MENNHPIPFVSLCTPTFNRRHFFPILFEMFKQQTYPKNRMEWIIIDDGTDKVGDLIKASGIKQIKYIELPKKLSLGAKRNLTHTYCKGSIIVYVDDDDYFPPERVEHSVDTLLNAKNGELIAGSSEIYLYFKKEGLYQFGPYTHNHATAGTFAFKRQLLEQTKYDETSCLAEESHFLKNFTIPMIQLDPVKTILVFPHGHNSFDKHTLLNNKNAGPVKPCTNKTVDDFIKGVNASLIKDFFINKMHIALDDYKPGEPSMKPDVLLQTRQMKIKRELMELEMQQAMEQREYEHQQQWNQQQQPQQPQQPQQQGNQQQIMIKQPDGTTIPLTNEQVCDIMMQQQYHIIQLTERIRELEYDL